MSARQHTFIAAMLAMATAGAVVTAARVSPQAAPSRTLIGTVTDTSRQPLPGAVVELSLPASTGSIRTVTTGGDGKFSFERVVPGLYVLTVRLAGFASAIRDLEVGGGGEAFQFDVQLQPLLPGGTAAFPSPALPDRRVVCGLTMITPRNPDPKMIVPGAPPLSAIPFTYGLPGSPNPQAAPPPAKGTLRTIQPTMCWDPAPVAPAPGQ